MTPHLSEFLGTATLVLMGNCVSANALLGRTKGENDGWLSVCIGWSIAMFVAVWVAIPSGAHLNPAVTASLAATGDLQSGTLLGHIGAQFAGAVVGAAVAAMVFLPHWRLTGDPVRVHAALCPTPGVRAPLANLLAAFAATFVYVFAVHVVIANPWQTPAGFALPDDTAASATDAWRAEWWRFSGAVALVLGGVMLGIGGSSGGSINPARDVAGRVVHALLPLRGKGAADWSFVWVPIVGSVGGAVAAALAAKGVGL